jgi:hypothetical protein
MSCYCCDKLIFEFIQTKLYKTRRCHGKTGEIFITLLLLLFLGCRDFIIDVVDCDERQC